MRAQGRTKQQLQLHDGELIDTAVRMLLEWCCQQQHDRHTQQHCPSAFCNPAADRHALARSQRRHSPIAQVTVWCFAVCSTASCCLFCCCYCCCCCGTCGRGDTCAHAHKCTARGVGLCLSQRLQHPLQWGGYIQTNTPLHSLLPEHCALSVYSVLRHSHAC